MHTDLPKKESAAASAQTKKRGFFSKRAELDLTNGPLFSSIVRFAIPILLANLVTTLFSAADMFVLSLFSIQDDFDVVTYIDHAGIKLCFVRNQERNTLMTQELKQSHKGGDKLTPVAHSGKASGDFH